MESNWSSVYSQSNAYDAYDNFIGTTEKCFLLRQLPCTVSD